MKTRKVIFGTQGKAISVLVVVLSLVSWWKQGIVTALIGGASLYAFLISLLVISTCAEERRRK